RRHCKISAHARAPGAAPRAPRGEDRMKPLTCAKTRRRIHAFYDGELSVPEQIAVSSHLEWCDERAAALEDMQNVGAALRSVLPGRTALSVDEQRIFPAAVVNRM